MSGVKEYKLKKDIITPEETIPAGAVFQFFSGIGEAIGYDYRVVKSEVEDFDEWFEAVKQERWRAEENGEYFTVWHGGLIRTLPDLYTNGDYYNFNTGNYFKTENEADDYRSYLLAKQRLKDSVGGHIPEFGVKSYTVTQTEEGLYVHELMGTVPGGILFRTREEADESRKKHEDDWEFVIRYEAGGL